MKIALIGCTKRKRNCRSKAIDLYDKSSYFVKRREYANRVLKADEIYILSALHKLLPSEKVIDPYDKGLKDMSRSERIEWADEIMSEIEATINKTDDIFILSGSDYSKDLCPLLLSKGYSVNLVLQGKGGIGYQMNWLDSEVAKA